jgi:hypothetical protein
METTLHRQLKALYCADPERQEVHVDGFRIDAVTEAGLIEIQQAGLAALRRKALALLESHPLTIVKPLVARRVLIKRLRRGGPVHSTRTSPRHETVFDMFEDLVHFVDVFPHPRLSLHVLLTEQEEHRVMTPQRRRRDKGYRVDDRRLLGIVDRYQLRTREDLRALLPDTLPATFSTEDIARHAAIPRWLSQKAAYCLRMTGVAKVVGKSRNTRLYRWTPRRRRDA